MSNRHSRRTFIKAAGAASLIPLVMPSLVRAESPNALLNHASIGVGGMMGGGDFATFKAHKKLKHAAVCDVDANILAGAAKQVPSARAYQDWREMFDKEGDKIDSVNVTIPDHMHAIVTMRALSLKKHVYCQKPLCHEVAEVRAITKAAAAAGVRTQLGTQAAAYTGSRMVVQIIQDGLIGKIKRVVQRANRPGIGFIRLAGPRPAKGQAPPKELNWDHWIGTAPMREFSPGIYHPSVWRCWQDFGTGWTGDIGGHLSHNVFRSLELTAPKTITAKAQESWVKDPARRADNWPQSNYVNFLYPATKYTEGDCQVEWYDGEFLPGDEIFNLISPKHADYYYESSFFIGTEGAMLWKNDTSAPVIYPRDKFPAEKYPKVTSGGEHHHNFVDACFTGEKTESDFSFSGPMMEGVLLGTVALRCPGETLEWDREAMKITNNERANSLLKRTYRAGWEVAGVA